ncbi:hypothetical protein LEP1GSC088_1447 [Leptospira interrogans str. L1207]|uniref:Uncharacterized protein n=2 Tax=Leptospira interrogans TaxID=173 RepID=M6I0W0_LEPIR|nr:hypothetical protein LEP1GSC087_3219 [Leptospira interrogans serovar Bataviae str. L1111]EMF41603.1 hypothetical protein LEP1GSC067_0994 [Leptospira interrogans serovar Lora str. TE 1992]EMF73369.1 hypothetical protein LEP1GSC148_1157 [Leptospira interrogans serovar Canicola str. LT1962]EMM96801.1 hypothetical protein LEP1GSC158_1336 [Leptospira interrogans serovar Zanoni str. LT2156]EMN09805.1 hypothetical protein LEP1GSC053_2522 [Leptospira interrogans serovar Muenchen str. Brem 129]EMN48
MVELNLLFVVIFDRLYGDRIFATYNKILVYFIIKIESKWILEKRKV